MTALDTVNRSKPPPDPLGTGCVRAGWGILLLLSREFSRGDGVLRGL
jgi:hypothetical protein